MEQVFASPSEVNHPITPASLDSLKLAVMEMDSLPQAGLTVLWKRKCEMGRTDTGRAVMLLSFCVIL